MDITLRSCTKEVIQYFKLRSGYDKHCGGENTRVNLETDAVDAVNFGTVKVKKFLVSIAKGKLMCPEIEDLAKVTLEELEAMHGADDVVLKCFDSLVFYSTGRYIIRDEGGISKDELSQNYFYTKKRTRCSKAGFFFLQTYAYS